MKAHIIENNVVINTIEVDSLDFLPNLIEATDGSIGWSYVDGVFSPPVPFFTEEQIRTKRDSLLAESDWVTVKAVDQNAQDSLGIQIPQVWLDYRQALRDITGQDGFPHTITWPTKP